MFTGIIEEVGRIDGVSQAGDTTLLRISAPRVASDAVHGASIAVDGVCLTVVEHDADGFTADVMGETLNRSTLGAIETGSAVNLERAVTSESRMAGHVVQGHVDAVGEILARTPHERWEVVRIALPRQLAAYLVDKGSITVDGISLTVSAVSEPAERAPWFEISLIPTTLELTTIGAKTVGDKVNLEVDVLAKYVERALAVRSATGVDE